MPHLAYIAGNLASNFEQLVAGGISDIVSHRGGIVTVYDTQKSTQMLEQDVRDAIEQHVDGVILCPAGESEAGSALQAMHGAGIPVVITGNTAVRGPRLALVHSDDETGAFGVGVALAQAMREHGRIVGEVGLVGAPLSEIGALPRTVGFMRAMDDVPIALAGVSLVRSGTANEAFTIVREMLATYPTMRGLFAETSSATRGAQRAAYDRGGLLVAGFGSEPDLVGAVRNGGIAVCGLQQPRLVGRQAAQTILLALVGRRPQREIRVPVLVVTKDSMQQSGSS